MKKDADIYRKMRCILGGCAVVVLAGLSCCGKSGGKLQEVEIPEENKWEDEITIMHVDAEDQNFLAYIDAVEKELKMKINVLPYPANADSRHGKVSSLLAAGDASVDIFAVNDEMINAFKHKGYLEPLQDDVMDAETAQVFEAEYLEKTVMAGEQIYSAPYMLDVLALWINEEWLQEAPGRKPMYTMNWENLLIFLAETTLTGRMKRPGRQSNFSKNVSMKAIRQKTR